LIPTLLKGRSGIAPMDRFRWASSVTVWVDAGWTIGLGGLACTCAVADHRPENAPLSFLGAIYGLVYVLIMVHPTNRTSFIRNA
jgi:hypothetical protein